LPVKYHPRVSTSCWMSTVTVSASTPSLAAHTGTMIFRHIPALRVPSVSSLRNSCVSGISLSLSRNCSNLSSACALLSCAFLRTMRFSLVLRPAAIRSAGFSKRQQHHSTVIFGLSSVGLFLWLNIERVSYRFR
jgi:hypothetical protein